MRSLRAFGLAAAVTGLLAGMAGTAVADDTPAVTPFIVGGEKVTSAPWAAAVHYGGAFHCSGSIIAPGWALTAEHCLGKDMFLRVGSVQRSSGGTEVKVVQQIAHPTADIALLKLEKPVETTYAKLATTDPKVGDTNAIFGWGREKYDWSSPAAEQLKTANVRVDRINKSSGETTIASTGINGGAWSGDSGGAQFAGDVQVGVASTASALGDKKQNYVSVATYRQWIKDTAGV